ncbi:MAG: aldose 1-epimerase family protein [Agathobacter sp.]|nr:aldose 1-epimerase family protein [Agathobacter sp.]
MARYGLENDKIRIEIDSHGAELKSLVKKETGAEYMWCADAKYWGRTSPVLFPVVGNVSGKQYRTKGKTFDMGQHGFARDMEFTLESQTDNEIWFVLRSNEETLAKYPYEFVLKLGYRLDGAKVEVLWHVENPSEEELPFAIGGHPAFYCPVTSGGKQSDCYIQFDIAGSLKCSTIDGYLVGDRVDTYELEDGMLRIDEHLFDNDALIIEKQNIKKVSLCDPKKQAFLTIEMDAPLFGIWRPADPGAPFVCIEPWYGRSDRIGYAGELRDREYENVLAAGENWDAGYTILV